MRVCACISAVNHEIDRKKLMRRRVEKIYVTARVVAITADLTFVGRSLFLSLSLSGLLCIFPGDAHVRDEERKMIGLIMKTSRLNVKHSSVIKFVELTITTGKMGGWEWNTLDRLREMRCVLQQFMRNETPFFAQGRCEVEDDCRGENGE